MAETITGKLEAIAKNKTGIKVGEKWYNMSNPDAQNKHGANRGDTIAFQWEVREVNGRKSNAITTVIKVVEKGQAGGDYKKGGKGNYGGKGGYNNDPAKQASIIRQSCMGYAATIVAMFEFGTPEEAAAKVLEIADKVFVPYASEGKVEAPASAKKASGKKPTAKKEAPVEEFEEVDSSEDSGSSAEFDDDFPF